MDQTRVIEVKKNILAANDEAADAFRAARAQEGTFFVDVMASPGAGKTTLLLALIRELRARGVEALGVIEADLEKGTVTVNGEVKQFNPLSENVRKTLEYGGLIPRVRAELGIEG